MGTKERKKKKVIKKRKITKKKVSTGRWGQPVISEEVTEENLPEDIEITVTDERDSVIDVLIKPVVTEVTEDATTHTHFTVEDTKDIQSLADDKDAEKVPDDNTKQIKKKTVIKKRKITRKKSVTGEDTQPIVTEEVTEVDLPEEYEVTIMDEKESVVESVVKPVITEIREDD